MIFPSVYGKVIVVDDEKKEGIPLVEVLTKNGVPVAYYSGDIEELPISPIMGVRFLFLDIVLGTEGQETKSIISKDIKIITKIVDIKNGPFVIIAWTKHQELLEELRIALKDSNISCFLINLKKSDCIKTDGSYDIKLITEQLFLRSKELGLFELFLMWENIVHMSSIEIIDEFNEFEFHGDWNEEISKIFFALAKGLSGEILDQTNKEEIIKNSFLAFNQVFLDTLDSNIRSYNIGDRYYSFQTSPIKPEIRGKLNSKLLISEEKHISLIPGNVYRNNNFEEKQKKDLIKYYIDYREINKMYNNSERKIKEEYPSLKKYEDYIEKNAYNNSIEILIEVSPCCDYVQNKLDLHRTLSGMLLRYDIPTKLNSNAIYASPLIYFDNKLYKMIIDYRSFHAIKEITSGEKNFLFRVKMSLLVDIQAKLASHINRPGVMSIE